VPMCREMLPVRCDFFLDEMIRLWNEMVIAKLVHDGLLLVRTMYSTVIDSKYKCIFTMHNIKNVLQINKDNRISNMEEERID
jgi:hypothetical protein